MSDFIPKQYKKEQITVRISTEKLEKIDCTAMDYDISRSELINQCIDYAFENIHKMPHIEKTNKRGKKV